MSTLNEDIRAIMAKMPEDQRHKFITAAYTDIVGYDPFTDDDVTMTLEQGEEALVGIIAEYATQGEGESALHSLARAYMAIWPNFQQLSLDEWLSEYDWRRVEDIDGCPVTHALLTQREYETGRTLLGLFDKEYRA